MLSRHVLKVSDFQIFIKSCSIESRNDPSPKSEVVHEKKFSLKISYSTHACLAQLDQHQTCNPAAGDTCPRSQFFVLTKTIPNDRLVPPSELGIPFWKYWIHHWKWIQWDLRSVLSLVCLQIKNAIIWIFYFFVDFPRQDYYPSGRISQETMQMFMKL